MDREGMAGEKEEILRDRRRWRIGSGFVVVAVVAVVAA